jgi:hypothetical protein
MWRLPFRRKEERSFLKKEEPKKLLSFRAAEVDAGTRQ